MALVNSFLLAKLIVILAAVSQCLGYLSCLSSGPCCFVAFDNRGKYFFRILVSSILSAISIALFNISFSSSSRFILACSRDIAVLGGCLSFMGDWFCQSNLPCFLNHVKTVVLP